MSDNLGSTVRVTQKMVTAFRSHNLKTRFAKCR